ncbi:hypothetical protein SAMN02745111_02367 [Eubacterium uniforme]|uniref:Zinc-finger n=1 Tax=Eubacterium uniforme TaxID=39495 RepID=A0A1T4W628_9FIRM|nr:hypothetical protein [Eubacterium uniforme]SKA72508.1 hypothetical protein SAMN02745111_02367 [Eubacterium uniforme]
MDCREFHIHINDFLDNKIDDEKTLEEFVEHANSCDTCKDDLEIYYAVASGLDSEAKGTQYDYDFEGKLNTIIDDYKEDFDINYKVRFFSKTLFFIAEFSLVVSCVLIVLNYLRLLL